MTLAEDLDVTRSAVNQIWHRLVQERDMQIRGLVDYGRLGISWVFGWAESSGTDTDDLSKFSRWLTINPFTSLVTESVLTSTMDTKVYFEALVPKGQKQNLFLNQLNRFRKRPYGLTVTADEVIQVANHINLGLFDGRGWHFDDGFRLEATIGVVKDYAEILPTGRSLTLSREGSASINDVIIASAMESEFHISSQRVSRLFSELGFWPIPDRTLRRRMAKMRETMILPYMNLESIGLPQRLTICFQIKSTEAFMNQLLHAQASMFPQAHVLSGSHLAILSLRLPVAAGWLKMTDAMAQLFQGTAQMFTFLSETPPIRKGLVHIHPHLEQSDIK